MDLQSFELFPKLPKELRDMVWKEVANEPRVVPIYLGGPWSVSEVRKSPIPALFHVSQEARDAIQWAYGIAKPWNHAGPWMQPLPAPLINYKHDIVLLKMESWTTRVPLFVRHLIRKVHRLAIPRMAWYNLARIIKASPRWAKDWCWNPSLWEKLKEIVVYETMGPIEDRICFFRSSSSQLKPVPIKWTPSTHMSHLWDRATECYERDSKEILLGRSRSQVLWNLAWSRIKYKLPKPWTENMEESGIEVSRGIVSFEPGKGLVILLTRENDEPDTKADDEWYNTTVQRVNKEDYEEYFKSKFQEQTNWGLEVMPCLSFSNVDRW